MFNDKEFLSDPEQWPKTKYGTPFCCLKRKQEFANVDGMRFGHVDSIATATHVFLDSGLNKCRASAIVWMTYSKTVGW